MFRRSKTRRLLSRGLEDGVKDRSRLLKKMNNEFS